MISGHWTWEAQMAGAATSVAKPYACHAGLAGWEHGWSGAQNVRRKWRATVLCVSFLGPF